MAMLMLSVMGAVAEFESTLIRERQREGITLAKQRGVFRGCRRFLIPEQIEEMRERVEAGEAKARIAGELGISRQILACYASTNPGTIAEDHALFASRRCRPGRGIQTSFSNSLTTLPGRRPDVCGFVAGRWT